MQMNKEKRGVVREAVANCKSNGHDYPVDATGLMEQLREHGVIEYDDHTPAAMSWFQAVSAVLEEDL